MARTGVLNREVLIEARNGRFRFFDWNLVNTSNGGCWEPRDFGFNNEGKEVDFDDAIRRIDKVSTGVDFRDPYHRDGSGTALVGGILSTGRKFTFDTN